MEMAQSSSGPPPRQKPRYSAQLKVDVFTPGLEHLRVEKTANISQTGLFICTEITAKLNDKFHLRIIFSDQDAYFDVKAKVIWICDGKSSHPRGLGLHFVELNEAQNHVIDSYLKKYVNVQQ